MQTESFRRQLVADLTPLHGPDEARALVRLLLAHLTGEARLHAPLPAQLPPDTAHLAEAAAQRLRAGEPVQHVIGQAHFYGRDFLVSPEVLIPRPETEALLVWARDLWLHRGLPRAGGRFLDMGTGSGCLLISLERELAARNLSVEALGVDRSEAALAIARQNAQRLGAAVHLLPLDLLQADPSQYRDLDLLLSNPPYIPERERPGLQPQVRDFEPGLALFVPDDDPLLFYRHLARLGRHWLKPGGWLMVEIHRDFGAGVVDLLQGHGYQSVTLRQDLAGRDRMVAGQRPA